MMATAEQDLSDFIRDIITEDVAQGKYDRPVHTRFPPEPNGYLHIGHAKSIVLNFGVADEFSGLCNLRFDDTNPTKEEEEYVRAIIEDVRWLGYDWEDRLYYASDYFDQLYQYALELIRDGKAYVDDLSPEEIRAYRGTLTEPGRESPYRDRSVKENLDLFKRMKAGEFAEGEKVLRAKIDMSSPNINLRDPIMYRILYAHHQRTGDEWCIYPMYDWAHGQSDSIEGITHSLCTLEFKNNRPLYNWFLDQLDVPKPHPRQIEFARLNLTYTVMSKRRLIELVDEGYVRGWDDPRMPTLAGMRRAGVTPEAIRNFIEHVGVGKSQSTIQRSKFDHFLREDLNARVPRVAGVLNPLKVVITNFAEDQVEMMEYPNHPGDDSMGTREVPFTKVIFIDRDDFREDPPKRFWRLSPGKEVRLRYAYFMTCQEVIKDEQGEVIELRCTIDPATRGGSAPDGRKVKGTLHWVSGTHALDVEVRLYDRLFNHPYPLETEEGEHFTDHLNPQSLQVLKHAKVEPSVAGAEAGDRYQFERVGYFCVDPDSTDQTMVFNQTIALRDSWAKIEKQQAQQRKGS